MKIRTSLIALVLVSACSGSALAQTDYHSEGLSFGTTQLQPLQSNVNNTNAQASPDYTNSPTQESEFGGPSLFNLGSTEITNCAAYTPGPNAVANQECGAVNFLAKNPLQPYAVSSTDPIITGIGKTISGASGTVVGTGCTEETTTTPASYTTETCNEYYLANNESCTEGEVVDVTAYSNFACDVTTEQVVQESCTDDVNCVLSYGACQPVTFNCTVKGSSSQCCSGSITCNANGTSTLTVNTCCSLDPDSVPGADSFTTTITDEDQFLSGVPYDQIHPTTDYIVCNQQGQCNFSIGAWECTNPSVVDGPTEVLNDQFNLPSPAQTSCTDTGGCASLDALTQ